MLARSSGFGNEIGFEDRITGTHFQNASLLLVYYFYLWHVFGLCTLKLYVLRWISCLLCSSSADDASWQNVPRQGARSALGTVSTKRSYCRSCDTTQWNLGRRHVRRRFPLQDRGGSCDLRQWPIPSICLRRCGPRSGTDSAPKFPAPT